MALTNKLTAIADAIRAKTGGSEQLSLDDMATEIAGISGGGGNNNYPFKELTGSMADLFRSYGTAGFSDKYNDQLKNDVKMTTSHITSLSATFDSSAADQSQLVLNCDNYCTLAGMLGNSFKGVPPTFGNTFIPGPCSFMGNNASLTEIPQNQVDKILINSLAEYHNNTASIFHSVKNMRSFPQTQVTSHALSYSSNFDECYCLDEILNLQPADKTFTSSSLAYIGYRCSHLKRLTFQTNNGQPYVRQQKNQTMRLGDRTGYFNSSAMSYSSLNRSKNLDSNYANLKNDPDAWANNLAYSRYDHDSAVETISTLPDTSAYLATAGGTNTIQFKTGAGSATDAGAVSDMTAAEIAVATNKGQTVSFV